MQAILAVAIYRVKAAARRILAAFATIQSADNDKPTTSNQEMNLLNWLLNAIFASEMKKSARAMPRGTWRLQRRAPVRPLLSN